MKKQFLMIVLFVFMGSSTLLAQARVITGTVTSSVEGEGSIPGVSVVVPGTTIGVYTDLDGKYTLNVPPTADNLVFTFVGMKTQEIAIGNQTSINVVMEPDIMHLDEVIVVGYGTQKREAKTGSVGVVSNNEIQNIPEVSIDKMLAGKIAGVQVTANSGQPGSDSDIRIRGISSIYAGTDPLYVIDGIPVMTGDQSYFTNSGNALSTLNPNDIESITVLKDASAASIYGSRAANGVILVSTKTGKSGGTKLNFRTSYGIEQLTNDRGYRPLSAEEFLTYQRLAVINAGVNPDNQASGAYYYPLSLLDGPVSNWLDELTRLGNIYNAELSVEGGNERTSNFFSLLYDKHEGIVYGSDFEKFSFRSNMDHKINDKLKMGTRITGASTMTNDVPMQDLYFSNPIFSAIMIQPFKRVMNEDGTYNLIIPENSYTNPLANAKHDQQWEKQYRLNGNAYLEWNIIPDLTAKTTNSIEYTDGEGTRYWDPKAHYGTTLGTTQVSRTRYMQLTTSNTVTFNKLLNENNLNLIAGQEATQFRYNEYYVSGEEVDPGIPFLTSVTKANDDSEYGETAYTMLSFFGVANYNYASKYFLSASLRTDGSSRFGAKNRWGTFWSLGLSWNLHEEGFMDSFNFINLMKIRGSYGKSGNFNIGNYDQYGLYGTVEYNGASGMEPSQPSNPELGWENNFEYNAGLDFAIFERFTGSLDVYSRRTEDMLLDYPLSRTSGFVSIMANIGSIKNAGLEFMIDASIINNSKLKWDAGFNISHNKSEILDLGKDEQFVNVYNPRILHKVGEQLYSFYLYDYRGVNPANGDALWMSPDGELTKNAADANRIIAGSPEPKFTGGLNTNLAYAGISLDINFEYKTGNLVILTENVYANSDGFSWGNNYANTQLDYWQKPGDIVRNPKPLANNTSNSSRGLSTRWLYDGSYLRVKNITLSYTIPKAIISRIGIQGLRVYANAVNLYTFHKVDFFDPERGVDGSGSGIYPQTKKITAGLELSF